MQFSFSLLAGIQVLCIFAGFQWYLRKSDEIPLLTSAFLAYVASFRYWVVTAKLSGWVNITNLGLPAIDDESALSALLLLVIGEVVMLSSYMLSQKRKLLINRFDMPPRLERSLRPAVLTVGIVAIPTVLFLRKMAGLAVLSGRSVAFQISNYLLQAPMMLVGIGCLLILLWKFRAFKSPLHRCTFFTLIAALMMLTYGPSARFTFLGWLLAGTVILSAGHSAKKRIWILGGGLCVAMILFAFAGASRNPELASRNLRGAAWARAFSGSDGNMLDGFVLIRHIYPEKLGYSFGMEHLEILLRPIPRSLWPGKPVGGYMNKLGITTADTGFTLGISPSVFGSFYAEGGLAGIIVFSALYAWALARLVLWSARLHPFAGILIRGVLCAGLVPLLRGGDLPGIYAWFGMAFWPCLLLLWLYRSELMPCPAMRVRQSAGTAAPQLLISRRFVRRAPASRYRSLWLCRP